MEQSIVIEGQTYKIGFRGKVYTQRGDEWVSSDNYTPGYIRDRLKDRLKSRRKMLNDYGDPS